MAKFRTTTVLTVGGVFIIVGLALSRRVNFSNTWLVVVLAGLMLQWCRQKGIGSIVSVCLFATAVGLGRGHTYMRHSAEYQQLMHKPITVSAVVDTDAIYGNHSQLSFDASQIVVQPSGQKLAGKVKVEGMGVPMVYRGDSLQISGSMSPTKGSAQGRFSFAKLTLIRRGSSRLDVFRRKFIAGMQSVVPEPEASFGVGLLLGQRSTIPKEINDQLSITGLTHLVAVSGYNLTIIIMAARKVFAKGSKFQVTFAATGLMLVFVLLTGLSASIVRAAIVSSLSLLAWYYGRQFKPLLLIVFTAAVTAAWNPFYLWSDIGWYLSFLAFYGVLLIAPLVSKVVSRGREPKLIGGLLAETISAQLMTLPIIMYIFGRVSNISLLANVLVVPLVPLAMLLTLVGGLAGMASPSIGGWVAWPAKVLLTYMIDISGIFSRVPHAAVEQKIDVILMVIVYVTVLIVSIIGSRIFARKSS